MAKTLKDKAVKAEVDKAPVHTDWWTGRQDAKCADVLKLSRVRRHLESLKDLPIVKKTNPKVDERRA